MYVKMYEYAKALSLQEHIKIIVHFNDTENNCHDNLWEVHQLFHAYLNEKLPMWEHAGSM